MKKTEINNDFLVNAPLMQLVEIANQCRKDNIGQNFELCGIVNAKSGKCSEDCKFCAQSCHHKCDVDEYPLLNVDEIVYEAEKAQKNRAKRFGIVTSGNKLDEKEIEAIARAIKKIKAEIEIEPCASLGALSKASLSILKQAGLNRYHHNIETSENFYPNIVTTHKFEERINTIKAAKEVGLQVCSGGIIGLGETWQDRIDMAKLLKKLKVDAVPLNILVPIKGTKLEALPKIHPMDVIRTICIFRLTLQDKTIKIAAGRESVLNDLQALGFMAGANGMLIGGYLTVKGRTVEEDLRLVHEVEELWTS